MMADLRLLPPSIHDERFEAYAEVIDRLGQLPLSVLAIYFIDQVESSALPHLGEQFNVMGLKGWILCETEQQQRELIKTAIELHRRAGTPFAIKRALTAVGYPGTEIEENPDYSYDGAANYGYSDGVSTFAETYDAILWGGFRVWLDKQFEAMTSPTKFGYLTSFVLEWKNVRSHLLSIGFRFNRLVYTGYPFTQYDSTRLFNGAVAAYSAVGRYDNYSVFYNGGQDYDGVFNVERADFSDRFNSQYEEVI